MRTDRTFVCVGKKAVLARLAVSMSLIATVLGAEDRPAEPVFHREFPPREPRQISPPVVAPPIHECAERVHVYAFVPHAKVEVLANGSEVVGQAQPDFGFADVTLTRPLELGETITATQTVGNLTSVQSYVPVVVGPYLTTAFNKPVVSRDLWACGRIVPVDKLVPGVRVHVFGDGSEIGSQPTAGTWEPVWTQSLVAGQEVRAVQIACEHDPAKTIKSPLSDPVIVKPDPSPIPKPALDPPIVGNDAVTLHGLFVGADVRVFDGGNGVGGGFATGTSNWAPVQPPVGPGSQMTATQKLCGPPSQPSDPVRPIGELRAPKVLGPICAGSQYAIVRDSQVNANVMLFRNGSLAGYAGAAPGDVLVGLGGGAHWSAGDKASARQSMGQTLSPLSNTVTVVSQLNTPVIEVLGGEPFFLPEAGEQAIDGAVFPRGRGLVTVAVQACCNEKVEATVFGPDNQAVADITLSPLFPGYYTGAWDWSSKSSWKVPEGIPVGSYLVQVKTGCNQGLARQRFYVIFNPDDVGGPARFSFNETGIWFGAGQNSSRALVYHLHPDDNRVFQKAIGAASGQVDPTTAATKVAEAEAKLFKYDLNYHADDVLTMLSSTHAQCADDANVLTSMLRGVGIPAHPATADADLETGPANWTFDTWVEALLPKGGQGVWTVYHSHWPDGQPPLGPQARSSFGATVGVATKSFNDLVIMAGESWVWNQVADASFDVSYNRTSCTEPQQAHTFVQPWLEDLCENGYWSPNHWDCSGRTTSGLRAEWRAETRELGFGGPLVGRLTLSGRGPIGGYVTVELVSDLPESKAFPDKVLRSYRTRFRIPAGGAADVPVRLRLPRTLESGHALLLRATVGDETVLVEPLEVPPAVAVTLRLSGGLRVGDGFVATAVVRSVGKTPLEGVRVKVSLPPGWEAKAEATAPRALRPGESRELLWRGVVRAPVEAAAVRVRAATANGGWAEAVVPVSVPEAASPAEPLERRP